MYAVNLIRNHVKKNDRLQMKNHQSSLEFRICQWSNGKLQFL